MKKLILGCCLFVLTVSFNSKPTLTIATDHYPPYIDKHTNTGILLDLATKICTEAGYKAKFVYLPWIRCEKAVLNNDVWAAMPYTQTEERLKHFIFSNVIIIDREVIFYSIKRFPDGPPDFETIEDLKQYKFGAVSGYYYIEDLIKHGIKYEIVDTELQNMKKLETGRVDFVILNQIVGIKFIKEFFIPQKRNTLKMLQKPYTEIKSRFLLSPSYPKAQQILKKINTSIQKTKNNGTYEKIMKKYNLNLIYK